MAKIGKGERIGSGDLPTPRGGLEGSDDFYFQRQNIVLDSERKLENTSKLPQPPE